MRSLRISTTLLLAALSGAAVLARAGVARAQADITPPLPNVLLLVDTSGSMEYMADGTLPLLDGSSRCLPPSGPGVTNENRWATLVSVLTGTFSNFSCHAQKRDKSSPFEAEYTVSGVAPYDRDYHLPFHRILSNDCTPGPGNLGATWAEWPPAAIKFHAWNDAGAGCAAPGFQQAADGLLDTFADRARFGLMTFDPLIDPGTGAAGAGFAMASGVSGTWSYYLDWQGGGAPASGNPPNCAEAPYEVGARGPAAPPWEGRLMPFGDPDATAATLLSQNDHVQLALLAMRPYGATPLAGMLEDARDFLYSDQSFDPSTSKKMGPQGDDYWKGGCRKTHVILLSDGEPNLDLRKEGCATGNGKCPYDEPHLVAHDMATGGDPDTRVLTFAIGFGLSSAAGIDCNTLAANDFAPGGQCDNAAGPLAACCTLARIAIEGGTTKAYFADDKGSLKTALSAVLGAITSSSKTRTIPAFSTASATANAQGDAEAIGYRFGAQFDTPLNSPLWVGRLARERYKCENQGGGVMKSVPQPVDVAKGDNFARNVNSNDAANPRRFLTVVGDKVSNLVHSARSIRPGFAALSVDDGMGLYSGAATNGGAPQTGTLFASTMSSSPEAFGIDPAAPPNQCASQLATSSAATCAERLVRWEVGEVDGGLPTRDVTGCQITDPLSGQTMGCELGSVYHSTPIVVGPPNEFLRDESYDQFALAQSGRPTVLYVSTTDGQLHAFKVAANDPNDTLKVDELANNELWSFLPPAVLPRLLTTYNQQSILLDGQIVARDVVLERTTAQAIAGGGAAGAKWSSILLSGGGGGGGYYFALDVTNPTQPEFLWQLSADAVGLPLFGSTVPTPAITTISISQNSGPPKDIAVAILPGGSDALLPGICGRVSTGPFAKLVGHTPRSNTRCWAAGPGRSLTIARLDNGEVIRSFVSPKAVITPNLSPSRITAAPFDSPLTGTPVPYPSRSGQVANRIYVGDADGTLWRVDLSKTNPADWTVEMMWDAYEGNLPGEGEPIQTPPIVSIDNLGQPVVLFSTGDQELITSLTPKTRVWSVTEQVDGTSYKVKKNFEIEMTAGERVTGPISLFGGTAYFSSFLPQDFSSSGNVCTYGQGKLWGVEYMSGAGKLDPADPGVDASLRFQTLGTNTIIFGVAVTQTPSCVDTATFDSPYFGGYVGISGGTPGEFQLVYQTSGQTPGQQQNASPIFTTKTLPAPRVTTRIDSWSAVVE